MLLVHVINRYSFYIELITDLILCDLSAADHDYMWAPRVETSRYTQYFILRKMSSKFPTKFSMMECFNQSHTLTNQQ